MAAAHAERRREGRKLRRRVAALCGQVLGFADAGAEQGITGADWPGLPPRPARLRHSGVIASHPTFALQGAK